MNPSASAEIIGTPVEELLSEVIGIDPQIIGRKAIETAAAPYQEPSGERDDRRMAERLRSNRAELDRLIEQVVIPETWFFREHHALSLLAATAVEQNSRAEGRSPLRILSAPCASGEEPFSIAIALLEAGLKPEEIHIEAVDVSHSSIRAAREAIFGKNSFRKGSRGPDSRWFLPLEAGYQIVPEVRERIHFHHDNLICPKFLKRENRPYSFIFCRNLLIYLHQEAKQRVFSLLDGLLQPGGLFFAGHAEVSLIQNFGYMPVRHPYAFACRKPSQPVIPAASKASKALPEKPSKHVASGPVTARSIVRREVRSMPPPSPAVPGSSVNAAADFQSLLTEVRRLSNQGRLPEAASLCRRLIAGKPHLVESQFLMGLISEAGDDHRSAEQHYLKALYLDPGHMETLVHLALFYERQGRKEQAKLYRDRLTRNAAAKER